MTTAANPFNSLAAVHKAAKQSDPLSSLLSLLWARSLMLIQLIPIMVAIKCHHIARFASVLSPVLRIWSAMLRSICRVRRTTEVRWKDVSTRVVIGKINWSGMLGIAIA